MLSGNLIRAIAGTSAVSACSSPSISIGSSRPATPPTLRARSRASAAAAIILPAAGCLELPCVEKLRKAILGLVPKIWRARRPVCTPMEASCSMVGSGTTPQSAKKSTPSSPNSCRGNSTIIALETTVAWGSGLMSWSSGRNKAPEEAPTPPTKPSTSPCCNIMAAK